MTLFRKWRDYSYADQRSRVRRLKTLALKVAVVAAAYVILINVFFPVLQMQSAAMAPSLQRGDRFVCWSFALRHAFGLHSGTPVQRGDVVLVNRSDNNNIFAVTVLDKLLRFFTIGKLGLPFNQNKEFLKRVVGLPGDSVSIQHYVVRVREKNSRYTLTEYEVAGDRHYEVRIPERGTLWDNSVPFSGNIEPLTLGPDEWFVLSDDRSNTNDSRTWGPIQSKNLEAVALFRYWPLSRLGAP